RPNAGSGPRFGTGIDRKTMDGEVPHQEPTFSRSAMPTSWSAAGLHARSSERSRSMASAPHAGRVRAHVRALEVHQGACHVPRRNVVGTASLFRLAAPDRYGSKGEITIRNTIGTMQLIA